MKRTVLKCMFPCLCWLFLFPLPLGAQERAALLNEKVAIFYPDSYQKEKHSPSFALVEEPKEIGALPAGWKTRVHFGSAFGKSLAWIETDPTTDLYGTGEVTGPLLRNGTHIELYNYDNYEYLKNHGHRLYQSHPWVLGVRSDGTAFGVLANNTWRQNLSLGKGILFSSEGPAFAVIVIEGESPLQVLQSLASLTGKTELPPLWSLGFQQCRYSYFPDRRVREVADSFRLKQIPCDVIWLDIHYMDGYRIFSFSPEYFPHPEETNEYLHQKGFKSVWMIDPGVKIDPRYEVYLSGEKEDVWVKTASRETYVGKVWPGDCAFPDFTMPRTAEWWGDLYKDFLDKGVDGVWNDMNEPAVFNGTDYSMPPDNIHRGGGDIPEDIHLRYHNVYGMLMAKASRTGMLKARPDKRPFLLTRSNFIGGQRYAATWTGDNGSNWKHLRLSVPMSLSLSLSGQPFNGPDIGGFGGNASPELFAHWMALGAFYPFSRAHKAVGNLSHEPWSFGPEVENTARTAIQRRYRLLPYLYTLFYESALEGTPLMQPVFFADVKDPRLRKEEQAFLFGGDLLVIPKWAENPALPEGEWRTVSVVGEDSRNDPYQPELKIRPGAIIPLGKIIQNTTEYALDTLCLFVSLDEKNQASGKLYHDAGEGFGYRQGEYTLLSFKARLKKDSLLLESTALHNQFPLNNKLLKVVWFTEDGVYTGSGDLSQPVIVRKQKP